MIFIGGISQGQKILDYVKTVICDRCGRYGRFQVVMTYMYFSFFFIPLFKWNRKYYVKMSCCGTVYELDPEVGKILARGGQVDILSFVRSAGRGFRRENIRFYLKDGITPPINKNHHDKSTRRQSLHCCSCALC